MAQTARPRGSRARLPPRNTWTDAWQRSVLFLDVMRRRAAEYEAHRGRGRAERARLQGRARPRRPHGSSGRSTTCSPASCRPRASRSTRGSGRSSIVDPRAGHGPGIGGFKADSEIGVAMKAGHPAYFIGFLPDPMPGQTILDIARAEAAFLETVIARHPEAEGKPCVIGNCQAGWAVMIVAALRPELFGPIIIAGTPLSYWAGVRGQYPMRYSGGLLGGSLADRAGRRPRRRHLRRRGAGAELREPEPGQHALDQAVQPLVEDRHRARALPRLREVVGRPRHAERRGDAVDRRRALRRQPPRRRRDPHPRRHRDRPAQHPLADRGLLLARATTSPRRSRRSTGSSTSTTASTTSAPMARPSSTPSTTRSGTSASSSPPASRGRSTTSSPRTST